RGPWKDEMTNVEMGSAFAAARRLLLSISTNLGVFSTEEIFWFAEDSHNSMKRPRADLVSAAAIDIPNAAGDQKTKKRKVEKAQSDANVNGNVNTSELSKEEKRELKKLRKHESEGKEKEHGVVNGKPEAGRKNEPRDPAKAAAKAARKAEKAQLRAAKDHFPIDTGVDGYNDEISIAEAEAKRKPARKLEKEQKNASRQTNIGKGENKAITSNVNGESKNMTPDKHLNTEYTEDPDLTALSDTEIESFLSTNFITIKDPSSQHPLRPITEFSYLPKSSHSPTFSTFSAPTAIQASAWPFLLSGRDVVGVAETGSGKTFAFGIPCIRAVSTKKSKIPARAVIISPTRELAVQIHTQIQSLCTPTNKIHTACVYGGVPKDPQRLALSTAHIV
ncbi:MAG: hypothetical protein L6R42_009004, partial [Xanthoria sp. 1 TBL-2021]